MSHQFSQNLIDRTKRYFRKHYKQSLTTEEAVSYLVSLADLYITFSPKEKADAGGDVPCPYPPGGAGASTPATPLRGLANNLT
jgi:hypothetical protein